MVTTLRIVLAIAAFAMLGPTMRDAATSPISIANGTADERAMTLWALGRFQTAGLELPAMTISFHDDLESCRGFIGLYSMARERLFICNRGDRQTEPRHTVLHELAHAWSFSALDGDEIDSFNTDRGLERWTDADGPWWLQGSEQAAEIVAWGLQDSADPYRSIWIHTERCRDLADGFVALSGTRPLNTSSQFCKP